MEDSKTEFKVKTYRDGGPLKMEENLHLLYQANLNTLCAKNPFLTFHMFDIMSIASVLSQSAARVKQDPGSMDNIPAMVNSVNEDFSQLIARCEKKLHSAETEFSVSCHKAHDHRWKQQVIQRDATR